MSFGSSSELYITYIVDLILIQRLCSGVHFMHSCVTLWIGTRAIYSFWVSRNPGSTLLVYCSAIVLFFCFRHFFIPSVSFAGYLRLLWIASERDMLSSWIWQFYFEISFLTPLCRIFLSLLHMCGLLCVDMSLCSVFLYMSICEIFKCFSPNLDILILIQVLCRLHLLLSCIINFILFKLYLSSNLFLILLFSLISTVCVPLIDVVSVFLNLFGILLCWDFC